MGLVEGLVGILAHFLLYEVVDITKSAKGSVLFYSVLLDYLAFGGTWSEDAPG